MMTLLFSEPVLKYAFMASSSVFFSSPMRQRMKRTMTFEALMLNV